MIKNSTLSPTAQTIIERYTSRRGISSAQLAAYLDPKIDPDRYALPHTDKAAARLTRAIQNSEHVHIFGDYDADGIASTTILLRFIRECTPLRPSWSLPDRRYDAYGLDLKKAVELVASHQPKLVIVVDNGSNSVEATAWLRSQGVDTIVIDHHPVTSPPTYATAHVNPKAHPKHEHGDLGNLCAAGLVLHFCAHLADAWNCADRWDNATAALLAGIATIADAVPMTTSNRALAKSALTLINTPEVLARCPGLQALVPDDGQRISQRRLQFEIIPQLNALGRLSSAEPGVTLLTTNDAGEAKNIAEHCASLNSKRKAIQQATVAQAVELGTALMKKQPTLPVVVLAHPDWNPGVVGPAASQVVERLGRSTILVGLDCIHDHWKGSGRAPNGDNLGAWLTEAKAQGLVVRGGGHAAAVGITLRSEQIRQLRDHAIKSAIQQTDNVEPEYEVIGDIDELSADEWIRVTELLEPFGPGNPVPLISARARCCGKAETLCLRETGEPWAVKAPFRTQSGKRIEVLRRDVESALREWLPDSPHDFELEITGRAYNGKIYYSYSAVISHQVRTETGSGTDNLLT